jgi:hypothetical protein
MTTFHVGRAIVTFYPEGAFTTYPDGATFAAQPHATPHYQVIAHRCGYGDDLLAYCREHEVCRHLIGEALYADGRSPVLWNLAHRVPVDDREAALEEAAVMTLQRWLRADERPIIGGVDWDALKRRALALLDG